jgi:hypothetical protein
MNAARMLPNKRTAVSPHYHPTTIYNLLSCYLDGRLNAHHAHHAHHAHAIYYYHAINR